MVLTVSAFAEYDYTAITSSPLVFPAGSTDGAMECMNITIMEDTLFEGDETFTVGLMVVTSGVMAGNTETIVTITDNEGL